jgi:hypothetical protein
MNLLKGDFMDSDEKKMLNETVNTENAETTNVVIDDVCLQSNEPSPSKERSRVFENSNLTGNFNRINEMGDAGLPTDLIRTTFLYNKINISEKLIDSLLQDGAEITGRALPKKAVRDTINTFSQVREEAKSSHSSDTPVAENEDNSCDDDDDDDDIWDEEE